MSSLSERLAGLSALHVFEPCPACRKELRDMLLSWWSGTIETDEMNCPHCKVTLTVTAEPVPEFTVEIKEINDGREDDSGKR